MKSGEPIIGVGYDESNHGRYPELCVLVYSNVPSDFVEARNLMPKLRRDHKGIRSRLKSRDFAFTLFTESDYARIDPHYKKLGIVLGSLIFEEAIGDNLKVLIDGEWYHKAIDYAAGLLREVTELPADCIEIKYGKDYDRKHNVVNLADETAHWLMHRKSSFAKLREDRHRKPLLLDELLD